MTRYPTKSPPANFRIQTTAEVGGFGTPCSIVRSCHYVADFTLSCLKLYDRKMGLDVYAESLPIEDLIQ